LVTSKQLLCDNLKRGGLPEDSGDRKEKTAGVSWEEKLFNLNLFAGKRKNLQGPAKKDMFHEDYGGGNLLSTNTRTGTD